MFSVDSLRFQNIADALAEIADTVGGVQFRNAIATAPQTASAMPSLAAGVYHDALPGRGLPGSGAPEPLAEVLSGEGYTCGLWTDNFLFGAEYNYDRGFTAGNLGRPSWKKRVANIARNGPLSPAFSLLEWGYFNIYQRLGDTAGGGGSFYESAESLNTDVLNWLDSTDSSPVMTWVHYMDTHHPYQPPAEYLRGRSFNTPRSRSELAQFTRESIKSNGEGLSEVEVEDIVTAYDACCEYLGDELLSFIRRLQQHGHYSPERDVLAITADHGECLTPHRYGMMGHLPAAYWEEILRVPLLIARPDWQRNTIDGQVSLIDFMPTLLDAVGLPVPETAIGQGGSSPPDLVREYAYGLSQPYSPNGPTRTYSAVRADDEWKLFGADRVDGNEVVMTRYQSGREAAEEIVHVSDPENIASEFPESKQWDRLHKALEEFGPPVQLGDDPTERSGRLENHLQDLGYLD